MDPARTSEFAHIGKSVIIKGELSGSEDLYVDGSVEGTIELQGNNLTIGPNGQVRADVNAKSVIVQGKLEGNIHASERAELRKSAHTIGDIVTQRVAIEDGAYFKGKVDIQRESKPSASSALKQVGSENKSTTSAAASATAVATAAPSHSNTSVTKS